MDLVFKDASGRILSSFADKERGPEGLAEGAMAAAILDLTLPDRHLLLTSVLPMLTECRGHADTPTHPGWPDWAFLETLRRGQIVTDSVTQTTDSGHTSVDIGSLTAMTSRPGRRCQVRQKATDTAASPGACRGRLAAVGPASGRLSCPSGARTVDSPLP